MSLRIVILNYRTPRLALDCLASLSTEIGSNRDACVVVVDNGSGDSSAQLIDAAIDQNNWREWVTVVACQTNAGYAAGNNVGFRVGLSLPDMPKYFMILNPDTTVRPGAITQLVAFMDRHPHAGVAGCSIEDPHGEIQRAAHFGPTPLHELDAGARMTLSHRIFGQEPLSPPPADKAHRCDWVSGSSMIIRREVFEQVGLLDEGFFLYFEEADFCRRARRAGWEVWHVPASRIVHYEGAATGIAAPRKRRAPYWFASRRRFFVKAYRVPGLLAADALWALGRLVMKLCCLAGLRRRQNDEPLCFGWDLLVGDLRAVLCGDLPDSRQTTGRSLAGGAR